MLLFALLSKIFRNIFVCLANIVMSTRWNLFINVTFCSLLSVIFAIISVNIIVFVWITIVR